MIENQFKTGDKVKYRFGLTFIYLSLNPLVEGRSCCIHPTATCQNQPNLGLKRVDSIPTEDLTLV